MQGLMTSERACETRARAPSRPKPQKQPPNPESPYHPALNRTGKDKLGPALVEYQCVQPGDGQPLCSSRKGARDDSLGKKVPPFLPALRQVTRRAKTRDGFNIVIQAYSKEKGGYEGEETRGYMLWAPRRDPPRGSLLFVRRELSGT